jgi:hypothetical protein
MPNFAHNTDEPLVKKPGETRNTTEQLLAAPYGMQGATIITTLGAEHAVQGYCIVAILDDTVLDVSNCDTNWREDINAGGGNPSGELVTDITLPVGIPFYGDFTRIFLISGRVIVYSK